MESGASLQGRPLLRLGCALAAMAIYAYLVLVGITSRFRTLHPEHERALRTAGRPHCLALWHEAIFLSIWRFRGRGMCAMVSHSPMGEVGAWLARLTGNGSSRGGSSGKRRKKGGREALEAMAAGMLAGGTSGALYVDASRGPARVAKWGIVELARRTGAPILPCVMDARRRLRARTWDGTILPLPFNEVVVAMGAPLQVSPAGGPEENLALAARLDAVMAGLRREVHATLGR